MQKTSWASLWMTGHGHRLHLLHPLEASDSGVRQTTQTGPLRLVGQSLRRPLVSLGFVLPKRKYTSQTQVSLAFDKAIHAKLVAESPSQRERQRLGRLVAEHAGAWVTAIPSRIDGSDCVMSPSVSVRYRLGFQWRALMSVVLFACSLLTYTAITPRAAKRTLTSLYATTASGTS